MKAVGLNWQQYTFDGKRATAVNECLRLIKINLYISGWTMVFKAVGGVGKNVYEVYKSDQTSSEDKVEALDVTNKYRDHYKNRIVLAWEAFDATEVPYNKYYHHPSQIETASMR